MNEGGELGTLVGDLIRAGQGRYPRRRIGDARADPALVRRASVGCVAPSPAPSAAATVRTSTAPTTRRPASKGATTPASSPRSSATVAATSSGVTAIDTMSTISHLGIDDVAGAGHQQKQGSDREATTGRAEREECEGEDPSCAADAMSHVVPSVLSAPVGPASTQTMRRVEKVGQRSTVVLGDVSLRRPHDAEA